MNNAFTTDATATAIEGARVMAHGAIPPHAPVTIESYETTYIRIDVHHKATFLLYSRMLNLIDHYREAVVRIRDRAAFVTRAIDELEARDVKWKKDAGR